MRQRTRGYTIIEILVVIAIILILAMLVTWAAYKIRKVVLALGGEPPRVVVQPSPPATPSRDR